MGRLTTKEQRLKDRAIKRKQVIKALTTVPVLRNVDIEAIKKSFAEKLAAK